mgnify:CR=1 FL=1
MTYEQMNKGQLWKEITILVDSTHFSDVDKDLFLKVIEEYGQK